MKSDDLNSVHSLPSQNNIRRLLALESDQSTVAIIRLAWQAGLTPTEIANLKWSDISERTMVASGRTVPLCDELISFLLKMEQKSPYVIYSRKANGGSTTRVSVSRKAHLALNSVGETDTTLLDLRFDFIVHLLSEQPAEAVSRITNCEIRTLQEINKRYMPENSGPQRLTNSFNYEFDKMSLEKALDLEGSTLDAKVIMLAWMCGLSLEEMSKLTWDSIDLGTQTLLIRNEKIPIPEKLFKLLKVEEARGNERILKGKRYAKELTPDFLSRRAVEFFTRYGFDQMTLHGIRGKYNVCPDSEVKEKILKLFRRTQSQSIKEVAKQFNLSINRAHKLIADLVSSGHLKRTGARHTLANYESNWEKFLSAVRSSLDSESNLSRATLAEATGFASNLLQYYLGQAVKKGVLIKLGHGSYHYCH